MRTLMQLGLCCLVAPGLFAEHHGGGAVSGGHPGRATAGTHAGQGRYRGNFYGGYYEPFWDYGYSPLADQAGSNTTVVYPPPVQPMVQPMVPETAHSVIHEYPRPADSGTPPERSSSPILYLIAFRDKNIRAAMTYWVQDGALHYLDTGHQLQKAPLSSVDRDLSARLNSERHVPFNIQ